MKTYPKGHKKLLNAWAFYDWANSVYSLVIASAIFPIFYEVIFAERNHTVFLGTWAIKDTAFISFVTAFAFLVVAIISPILSGIADFVGNKKVFLRFFCYLGALSCISLFWFDVNHLFWGYTSYFFGLIGFWASWVFYNSYLPDIAYPEQQDAISAKAYSFGYIGSTLLLIFNLAMVMFPEQGNVLGLENKTVSLIALSWFLLTLDNILKLGVVEQVANLAKAIKGL